MKARNAVRFSISAVERKKITRLLKSFFFHVSNRCLKGKGSSCNLGRGIMDTADEDDGEASKRGDAAGVVDEQRWIRFISTTKVVETVLEEFAVNHYNAVST